MENAAKALMIAAEVLITILLLTLFAYLFARVSENTKKLDDEMRQSEISKYNQQFLEYDGRGTITLGNDKNGNPIKNYLNIQDVATIINMAQDCNKKQKYPQTVKVLVDEEDWTNENTETLLNDNVNNNNKYTCNVEIDLQSQIVSQIKINKVNE